MVGRSSSIPNVAEQSFGRSIDYQLWGSVAEHTGSKQATRNKKRFASEERIIGEMGGAFGDVGLQNILM